jgi:hypothetical protein
MNFTSIYPSVVVGLILLFGAAARWYLAPADRKHLKWLLVAVVLALPAEGIAEGTANALSRLRPLKLDEFVYRIDAVFGQPSFLLGRLVEHHKFLVILVSVTYGLLPMAMVAVFAIYLWYRTEAETLRVVWTFVLNLFAAVPIYLIFPVAGPRFAFAHFPDHVPSIVTPHLQRIAAAPNGIPSVHMSSALLVLWFLRSWRWGRYFGFTFLVLTMLATLGSGQHYFFDLLTAVPYAAAVYWLANEGLRAERRRDSAIQSVSIR